ncbi:hypothetical protein CTA1_2436 [Colletotrichum tanaceti]|uniref:Uncharacterized protein n=1 Tax=Colletotrichum tanaceti TaxID=1306861 RepID=A0A4U6X3D1_9PEZI|nr:hypothetical protein CTA1_2436 [Colletotrichum tanaceti]
MAQFGVLRHCLRLLFGRKQDASQQAPNDDTHPLNPPRAVRGSWIVLDLGEQHASRADQTTSPDAHAPTGRRETAAAVGPLRRPWVYSRFTMSTYQRHARVAKGATAATQRAEKSVNPLRMNPVSVEAPVNPLRMNPVNVEVPVHSETMVIGQLALRGDDLMSHAPSEAGESETSSIEAPRRHSQGPGNMWPPPIS